jgi:hypothetical protein
MWTTCCNIKKLRISATQCVCALHACLRKKTLIYSSKDIMNGHGLIQIQVFWDVTLVLDVSNGRNAFIFLETP